MSDRQLKRTIVDLTIMERKAFGSRRRFEFYNYLSDIFDFYRRLKRSGNARSSASRIAKLFSILPRKRTHPIRILIDVSSAADEKTRSRWCRALRYAWHERTRWTDIREFWRENHGAVGAAARWSALHSPKGNSREELDAQNLVPETSEIVDVPLLEPGQLFARGGRVFTRPDAAEADLQGSPEAEPPGSS
jgi:hypothetical protein